MKRLITTTMITLSLLLGLALWYAGRDVKAKAALAPALPFNSLTVTNTNDSGAGSLRQAIADAASGDTIKFNLSGCPCTITLTSGELVIGKNLSINGPGKDWLTISGNNTSRVFFINPGAPGATTGPPATNPVVIISNLTIANGRAKGGNGGGGGGGGGGATANNASGGSSLGFGGSGGVGENDVGGGGGGAGLGGAIFVRAGSLNLSGSGFTSNSATRGNGGPGKNGQASVHKAVNTGYSPSLLAAAVVHGTQS